MIKVYYDKISFMANENINSTNNNSTIEPNDQNKNITDAKIDNSVESDKEEEKTTEKIPTLEEDYQALKSMNLLRNIMIRMQYGKYPNNKIDSVLKRRMDFDESKYQGTDIVRIIISLMAVFFLCSLIFFIIWFIAKSIGSYNLKETSSFVISLFFLGGCSFAIFNNISVPDEKKLKIAIKERMAEIEKELNIEEKKDENNSKEQS